MAVNTDETLLTHLLFISGCAAWFLTGHELVPVCGPGVGDPDVKYLTVFHTPLSYFRFLKGNVKEIVHEVLKMLVDHGVENHRSGCQQDV